MLPDLPAVIAIGSAISAYSRVVCIAHSTEVQKKAVKAVVDHRWRQLFLWIDIGS